MRPSAVEMVPPFTKKNPVISAQNISATVPEAMLLSASLAAEAYDWLGRGSVKAAIVGGLLFAAGCVMGTIYKYRFLSAGENLTEKQQEELTAVKKGLLFFAMTCWTVFEGADALLIGLATGSIIQEVVLPAFKILKTILFELPVVMFGGKQDISYKNYNKAVRVFAQGFTAVYSVGIGLAHAYFFFKLTTMVIKALGFGIKLASPLGILIATVGLMMGLAGTYLTSQYDFQGAKSTGCLARANNWLRQHSNITTGLNTFGQGSLYAFGLIAGVKVIFGISLLASGPIGWGILAAGLIVVGLAAAYAVSRKKINGIEKYKAETENGRARSLTEAVEIKFESVDDGHPRQRSQSADSSSFWRGAAAPLLPKAEDAITASPQ